jgi:hypothetical protein
VGDRAILPMACRACSLSFNGVSVFSIMLYSCVRIWNARRVFQVSARHIKHLQGRDAKQGQMR